MCPHLDAWDPGKCGPGLGNASQLHGSAMKVGAGGMAHEFFPSMHKEGVAVPSSCSCPVLSLYRAVELPFTETRHLRYTVFHKAQVI